MTISDARRAASSGAASPSHAPSLFKQKWLLALVVTAGILNYVDRQLIAVLKPILARELGWSDADYGDLAAVFQFGAVLAFPLVGWLVDRLGPRTSNLIAVGSWSLAAAAHGLAVTLGQFAAARLALGATEAMGTPTAIKTLAALFDSRGRALALGVMNAASSVGAIVTPLALPAFALLVGWRMCFLCVGALGLFWCAAWMVFSARISWPTRETNADERKDEPKDGLRDGLGDSWRVILADRATWALVGAKVLSDQAWWLLLFWLPDLFNRLFHLDVAALGRPVACIYLMAAAGAFVGGALSTTLARSQADLSVARGRVLAGSALLAASMPLALCVDQLWQATAVLGLALAGHQSFSVNLFATLTDAVPASRVGRVTALGALCGNLGGMALLAATGRILSGGGGYLPILMVSALAYLLAPVALRALSPRRSRPLTAGDI
ncbi:ACS family hexuronate transporter-like MFS transporter [Rhodoblastus sphagnicola]|uniref:MFS transporter n=1 Tax=Rhodoblastus sphagnicola TaxID=333368 RepID=UPI0013048C61|nr:MFS transporter [Rhodoblastus sphagnicola]MBB4197803.1 ACS family hexuronate transporter-like MFS transporter [Rhodoblastus sphagnicola]